jgi:hypothetical protein
MVKIVAAQWQYVLQSVVCVLGAVRRVAQSHDALAVIVGLLTTTLHYSMFSIIYLTLIKVNIYIHLHIFTGRKKISYFFI